MKVIKNIYSLVVGIILLSTVMFGCSDNTLTEPTNTNTTTSKDDISLPWEPGMAYIKLKTSITPTTRAVTSHITRAAIFNKQNVKVEQVFNMHNEYANLKHKRGLDRWFIVKFDKHADVNKVIKELKNDPAIDIAQGSIKIAPVQTSFTPFTRTSIRQDQLQAANNGTGSLNFTDPYLKYQWHYTTTNDVYMTFKPGADINLFPAWQKETGNEHVIVAVMDSGIDFSHEDLQGAAWEGKDPTTGETIHGRNFWADETGNGRANDIIPGAHGTHVAGTIAARNNNNIGVCGIAGGNGDKNSGVRLMSCEIYGHDGTKETASTASIVKAFEFAAEHGASIMNCSWGYAFDRSKYLNNENFQSIFKNQFQLLKDGIDYFTDVAGCDGNGNKKPNAYMKGGLIFFASGNDAQYDIDMIPASYKRVIAVGAINSQGIPTDYMNKGTWVDILAPGGTTEAGEVNKGVLSTVPKNYVYGKTGPYPNTDFTLPDNNLYAFAQGTSMATPHVTGIAALVISKFGKQNNNFTNEDLRKRILGAVKPQSPYAIKSDQNLAGKMGIGFVDANLALADAETEKPAEPVISVIDYSTDAIKGYYDATITWNVTSDNDAPNEQHTAFAYDIELYKKDDMSKPVQTLTRYSYDSQVNDNMEQTFLNLETNTRYVVKMTARDRSNNRSNTVTTEFKTRLNHAPIFTTHLPQPLSLLNTKPYYHEIFTIKDEDNHSWTYTTTELPQGVELKRIGDKFDLLIKIGKVGKYEFSVTLTDQLGGKHTEKFAYEVVEQKAPQITTTLSDISLFKSDKPTIINLNNVFATNGITHLRYHAISSNKQIADVAIQGHNIIITPVSYGIATIKLTATNGSKESSVSFNVRVTNDNAPDVHAIYPIPAHSYIKALMRSNVNDVEVIVTMLNGRKVIETKLIPNDITHEITLGIDRLAPGTYYLLLKTKRVTSKHTFIKK